MCVALDADCTISATEADFMKSKLIQSDKITIKMPVQFKNTSEYSQKFCPMESRSLDDFPSNQGEAGMKSNHRAACYEPPIQHKKRLDGPPTSLSTNYFSGPSDNSEFALLGQQDKFAPNVPYQLKNMAAPSKIYKNKENFDDPPPPSKQLKMQKRIKPLIKERHPRLARSPPRQSTSAESATTPLSPPPAPRTEKPAEPIKEAMKDKDLKDVLGDTVEKEKAEAKAKSASTKVVEASKSSNMNEFVQTDMKKGVALSGSEAPAEYALKYKAGVAPPRPPKRFSEYQKQFQWKKGMKASPLLAAEQIVYRSNTELGPYKTDPVFKVSEYKRQFQPWKPVEVKPDLSLNLEASMDSVAPQDKTRAKKKKTKRSKSAGAVLPNEKQVEEEDEVQDVDEAAEIKEKLKQTHGKIRRLGTEYRANFKSPADFAYKKGAWKGANPPQLTPAATIAAPEQQKVTAAGDNKESADANPPLNNWFAEVIELRRRAEEYRKRAQGTHFSREHLVQLMAKQTDCWDMDSQASETVKALDLEAPKVSKRKQKENASAVSKSEDINIDIVSNGDSPALSDIDEAAQENIIQPTETKKKKKRNVRRSRKMAYLEEQKEKVQEQQQKLESAAKMDEDGESDDEGRRPTPLLRQQGGSARRHHLDLTTPAVGGALLTCPPSKNSKIIITSRSGDSYVTASDDYEGKQSPKKMYNLDKLVTMPILGMPSGDTHALRDDDAEEDKALLTHYVPTPLPVCDEDDKENAPEQKELKKHRKGTSGHKASKPSRLSGVQENHGKTYAKSHPAVTLDDVRGQVRDMDDDVMSVSMMSVASSSTLASEILERAQRRRNEFWGKSN